MKIHSLNDLQMAISNKMESQVTYGGGEKDADDVVHEFLQKEMQLDAQAQ